MLNFKNIKNTKICLVLSMILIVSFVSFSGCSKPQSTKKTPALSDIAQAIGKQMDLKEMIKLDDDKLQKIYEISPDELSEYYVYISDSNAKADELALIKVKDPSKAESLKNKISERVESQSKSFKDYIPEEYYKIQKYVIKAKNGYILMVISKDSDKVESTFDSYFK